MAKAKGIRQSVVDQLGSGTGNFSAMSVRMKEIAYRPLSMGWVIMPSLSKPAALISAITETTMP